MYEFKINAKNKHTCFPSRPWGPGGPITPGSPLDPVGPSAPGGPIYQQDTHQYIKYWKIILKIIIKEDMF